jgi:transcriptional regulator with XRE-family HTH domain
VKVKSFEELYRGVKQKDAYWTADAIYSFTEELNRLAEIEGVSRAEIARRLGTSAAYVTKIFRGDVNFTVESMVRLARAVGARIHVHLALEGHRVRWFDLPRIERRLPAGLDPGQFKKVRVSEVEEKRDGQTPAAA